MSRGDQYTGFFVFLVPAVHLFGLKVAPVFKRLHVVEKESNHALRLFQVRLHLGWVLGGIARVQEPHVLQHDKSHVSSRAAFASLNEILWYF